MSIARRSFLRAALNRRIQFNGAFTPTVDCVNIPADRINVLKLAKAKDGDESTYPAGSIVELSSSTTIKSYDRVIHVKYPASIYKNGTVSGPVLVDESDGEVNVTCTITLHTGSDLSNLSFKLYVEGE